MTARETLEHEWLKQLEEGLTANDVVQAQHASQQKLPDTVVDPLVEEDYPSSSESETPLEKSTEIHLNGCGDDSAFGEEKKEIARAQPALDDDSAFVVEEKKKEVTPVLPPKLPEQVENSQQEDEEEPEPAKLPEPEREPRQPESEPEAELGQSDAEPEVEPEKPQTEQVTPEVKPKIPEVEPEKPETKSKNSEAETKSEPVLLPATTTEMKPETKSATEQVKSKSPKTEPKIAPKPAKKSPPTAKKPEKVITLNKDTDEKVEILKKDKNDNISVPTTNVSKDESSKTIKNKDSPSNKKDDISNKINKEPKRSSLSDKKKNLFESSGGSAKDKISKFDRPQTPDRCDSPSKFRTASPSLRSESASRIASKFERSDSDKSVDSNNAKPEKPDTLRPDKSNALRSESTSKLASKFERSDSDKSVEGKPAKVDSLRPDKTNPLRSESTSRLASKFERSDNDKSIEVALKPEKTDSLRTDKSNPLCSESTSKLSSKPEKSDSLRPEKSNSLRSESTSKLASKFERSDSDKSTDSNRSSTVTKSERSDSDSSVKSSASSSLRSDSTSRLASKFERTESGQASDSSRSSSPAKLATSKLQRGNQQPPGSATGSLKIDSPRLSSRSTKVAAGPTSIAEKMAIFKQNANDSPSANKYSPKAGTKFEKKTPQDADQQQPTSKVKIEMVKKEPAIAPKPQKDEAKQQELKAPSSVKLVNKTESTKSEKQSSPEEVKDSSKKTEKSGNVKRVKDDLSNRKSPLLNKPSTDASSKKHVVETTPEKKPSTPTTTKKSSGGITVNMNIGGVSASGKKLHIGPLVSSAMKSSEVQQQNEGGDQVDGVPSAAERASKDEVVKTEKKNGSVKVKLGVGRPSWRRDSDDRVIKSNKKKDPEEADVSFDDQDQQNRPPKMKELRNKSQSLSRRGRSNTQDSNSGGNGGSDSPNSPRKNYRRLYVTKVRNSRVYESDFNINSEAAKIMQRVDQDVLQIELKLKSTDLKLLP